MARVPFCGHTVGGGGSGSRRSSQGCWDPSLSQHHPWEREAKAGGVALGRTEWGLEEGRPGGPAWLVGQQEGEA